MVINGYYTQHDFTLLANRIGLGEKIGLNFINKMVAKVENIAPMIVANSSCSGSLKMTILDQINQRCTCLKRVL